MPPLTTPPSMLSPLPSTTAVTSEPAAPLTLALLLRDTTRATPSSAKMAVPDGAALASATVATLAQDPPTDRLSFNLSLSPVSQVTLPILPPLRLPASSTVGTRDHAHQAPSAALLPEDTRAVIPSSAQMVAPPGTAKSSMVDTLASVLYLLLIAKKARSSSPLTVSSDFT